MFRSTIPPVLPYFSYRFMATLCLLAARAICQEQPEDWPSSYNVGPYKHIYPPTNLSVDQLSCVPNPALNKTCPLYIAVIMSFGGAHSNAGVVPGMQVALDHINARPDLLPGYTLHYTLQDSQCDHTTSLDVLHQAILEPPIKIAVIGSGCSVATETTAEVSHYYNVTQLSCTSASSELMNRKRFRRHFQLRTADISLAYGFFGVIRNSKWRKVSIVFQDANLFTTTMNELKRLLTETNVAFNDIRYDSSIDPFSVDPDSRVFVLSMYPPYAREILCKAYQKNKNFKYPRNIFFVNGWFPTDWWVGSEKEQANLLETYDCSVEQRKSLVPYTFAVTKAGGVAVNFSVVADNGYTGDDIKLAYSQYLNTTRLNVKPATLYQLCYDTVWTLARALNNTLIDLQTDIELKEDLHINISHSDFGLQHFLYNNSVLLENIFEHLSETNFTGIVGNIKFTESGTQPIDRVILRQFRYTDDSDDLRRVTIGYVRRQGPLDYQVVYYNESEVWPDGIPHDGVIDETVISVDKAVTSIFTILATCAIVFAVICIILNLIFRDKKLIRLTSPYLNTLIGVGAIILYIDIYIHVIPSTNEKLEAVLCNVDTWLTAIGYSLCYGTIIVKMCRIYIIFNNPNLKKKKLSDWKLAMGVFLLVVIDVIILLTYTLVEGIRGNLSARRIPNREHPEEVIGVLEIVHRYFIYVCNSPSRYITLGVLYGYKALLQIVTLIFAVSIRKVQIKGLNDAVYIIPAIYITSIVTSIIVVSTYTIVELVNVNAAVFCLCVFVGTTVILILVFIPPLVSFYKDPDGTNVFTENGAAPNTTHVPTMEGESESMYSLRKRIKELETQIHEMKTNGQVPS